jgi:hypothetical protein
MISNHEQLERYKPFAQTAPFRAAGAGRILFYNPVANSEKQVEQ